MIIDDIKTIDHSIDAAGAFDNLDAWERIKEWVYNYVSEIDFLEEVLHHLDLCYKCTPAAYASMARMLVKNRLAALKGEQ